MPHMPNQLGLIITIGIGVSVNHKKLWLAYCSTKYPMSETFETYHKALDLFQWEGRKFCMKQSSHLWTPWALQSTFLCWKWSPTPEAWDIVRLGAISLISPMFEYGYHSVLLPPCPSLSFQPFWHSVTSSLPPWWLLLVNGDGGCSPKCGVWPARDIELLQCSLTSNKLLWGWWSYWLVALL